MSESLLDKGAKGYSSLIMKHHITDWERKHRGLGPGDVVLFYSGYSDKYYRAGLAGRRFVADPARREESSLAGSPSGGHGVFGKSGVMTLGTDSASMGPIPELARADPYGGS